MCTTSRVPYDHAGPGERNRVVASSSGQPEPEQHRDRECEHRAGTHAVHEQPGEASFLGARRRSDVGQPDHDRGGHQHDPCRGAVALIWRSRPSTAMTCTTAPMMTSCTARASASSANVEYERADRGREDVAPHHHRERCQSGRAWARVATPPRARSVRRHRARRGSSDRSSRRAHRRCRADGTCTRWQRSPRSGATTASDPAIAAEGSARRRRRRARRGQIGGVRARRGRGSAAAAGCQWSISEPVLSEPMSPELAPCECLEREMSPKRMMGASGARRVRPDVRLATGRGAPCREEEAGGGGGPAVPRRPPCRAPGRTAPHRRFRWPRGQPPPMMPTAASTTRALNATRERPRATMALPTGTPAPKPIEYAVQASSAVTVMVVAPSPRRSERGWRRMIVTSP